MHTWAASRASTPLTHHIDRLSCQGCRGWCQAAPCVCGAKSTSKRGQGVKAAHTVTGSCSTTEWYQNRQRQRRGPHRLESIVSSMLLILLPVIQQCTAWRLDGRVRKPACIWGTTTRTLPSARCPSFFVVHQIGQTNQHRKATQVVHLDTKKKAAAVAPCPISLSCLSDCCSPAALLCPTHVTLLNAIFQGAVTLLRQSAITS